MEMIYHYLSLLISNLKVLLVAERGDSGDGWAAVDDFEFLYDPYKVGICPSMTSSRW